MATPTQEQLEALWLHCEKFIADKSILCAESVYQCDNVILNACEFIEGVCAVVGYAECEDD